MSKIPRIGNVFVGNDGSGKSVALWNCMAAETKQDRFTGTHFFAYSEESCPEQIMNLVNSLGVTAEFHVCPDPAVLLETLAELRTTIDKNTATGRYKDGDVPRINLYVDAASYTRFSRERGFPGRGRNVEFTNEDLRKAVAQTDYYHVTMSLSKT